MIYAGFSKTDRNKSHRSTRSSESVWQNGSSTQPTFRWTTAAMQPSLTKPSFLLMNLQESDSKTSLENETLWRHPCQWKYSYSSNSRRGNCSLCTHRIIRLRDGLIERTTK
jgi:hypothetical protein